MAKRLNPCDRINCSSRRLRFQLLGAFACTLATVLPGSADAQQACAPMRAVFERLRVEHGEIPAVAMLDQRGNRLVILANPATRSWSMFVLPSGGDAFACLVATGHEFGPGNLLQGRQS